MNFEERKAEILRRGNARIAAKKKKKRIILGAVIPVVLVALLALPVHHLLQGRKAEEKAALLQMEAIAEVSDSSNKQKHPQITVNETSKVEPGNPAGFPIAPPDVKLYSHDGFHIQPMNAGYRWLNTISEGPNIFYPGMVEVRIDTQYGYLILDASAYAPTNVYAECWDISMIGSEHHYSMDSLSLDIFYDPNCGELIPGGDHGLSKHLYKIGLKPGENIYLIHIQWPTGSASYSFRANWEDKS